MATGNLAQPEGYERRTSLLARFRRRGDSAPCRLRQRLSSEPYFLQLPGSQPDTRKFTTSRG